VSRSRSTFCSPRLKRERNDGVAICGDCRPPTHLRTKAISSRRRCTRCRSEVSRHRVRDHAQGCSKYPRRHSSRSSLMTESRNRRAVISASTFCRSTPMSVAPATPLGGRRRPSARKSNWPWQADAGANLTNPAGRAWGRQVLVDEKKATSLRQPSVQQTTLQEIIWNCCAPARCCSAKYRHNALAH
jgi:hypothetical protein